MIKYIVTGGAGFIGSNLVAALNARGERAILIVDDLNHHMKSHNLAGLRFERYMDKRELRGALRRGAFASAEAVFHLGACSSTTELDLDYLADNNTAYTRELCEWSLAGGRRFIYASSASTYGAGEQGYDDAPEKIPLLRPLNAYGRSKQNFDLVALREGWLDRIAGLKFFNVFGPNEHHKGSMRSVVHKAYGQIRRAGALQLFRSHRPGYSDGGQDRDFVHVRDAVAVALHFFDHPGVSGVFNCGTGRARTWLDLGRAVFAAMGLEPRIDFIDMPPELRAHYQYHTEADLTRLRATGCDHVFPSLEESVLDYVAGDLARHAWHTIP